MSALWIYWIVCVISCIIEFIYTLTGTFAKNDEYNEGDWMRGMMMIMMPIGGIACLILLIMASAGSFNNFDMNKLDSSVGPGALVLPFFGAQLILGFILLFAAIGILAFIFSPFVLAMICLGHLIVYLVEYLEDRKDNKYKEKHNARQRRSG